MMEISDRSSPRDQSAHRDSPQHSVSSLTIISQSILQKGYITNEKICRKDAVGVVFQTDSIFKKSLEDADSQNNFFAPVNSIYNNPVSDAATTGGDQYCTAACTAMTFNEFSNIGSDHVSALAPIRVIITDETSSKSQAQSSVVEDRTEPKAAATSAGNSKNQIATESCRQSSLIGDRTDGQDLQTIHPDIEYEIMMDIDEDLSIAAQTTSLLPRTISSSELALEILADQIIQSAPMDDSHAKMYAGKDIDHGSAINHSVCTLMTQSAGVAESEKYSPQDTSIMEDEKDQINIVEDAKEIIIESCHIPLVEEVSPRPTDTPSKLQANNPGASLRTSSGEGAQEAARRASAAAHRCSTAAANAKALAVAVVAAVAGGKVSRAEDVETTGPPTKCLSPPVAKSITKVKPPELRMPACPPTVSPLNSASNKSKSRSDPIVRATTKTFLLTKAPSPLHTSASRVKVPATKDSQQKTYLGGKQQHQQQVVVKHQQQVEAAAALKEKHRHQQVEGKISVAGGRVQSNGAASKVMSTTPAKKATASPHPKPEWVTPPLHLPAPKRPLERLVTSASAGLKRPLPVTPSSQRTPSSAVHGSRAAMSTPVKQPHTSAAALDTPTIHCHSAGGVKSIPASKVLAGAPASRTVSPTVIKGPFTVSMNTPTSKGRVTSGDLKLQGFTQHPTLRPLSAQRPPIPVAYANAVHGPGPNNSQLQIQPSARPNSSPCLTDKQPAVSKLSKCSSPVPLSSDITGPVEKCDMIPQRPMSTKPQETKAKQMVINIGSATKQMGINTGSATRGLRSAKATAPRSEGWGKQGATGRVINASTSSRVPIIKTSPTPQLLGPPLKSVSHPSNSVKIKSHNIMQKPANLGVMIPIRAGIAPTKGAAATRYSGAVSRHTVQLKGKGPEELRITEDSPRKLTVLDSKLAQLEVAELPSTPRSVTRRIDMASAKDWSILFESSQMIRGQGSQLRENLETEEWRLDLEEEDDAYGDFPQPGRCHSPKGLHSDRERLMDICATPGSSTRIRSIGRIDVSLFKPEGFTDSLVID